MRGVDKRLLGNRIQSKKFILRKTNFSSSLPATEKLEGPQGFTEHVLCVRGEGERNVWLQEASRNDK